MDYLKDEICTVSFKMPEEQRDILREIAADKGLNLSQLIRIVLKDYIRSELYDY